jgi:aldehyde dehydrogenase (NAD+)
VSGAKTFENRNPANTEELVGTFAKGSAQDMRDAASSAAAALPAWSTMSGPGRGNILYKAADILDRKFDSVAADMTREEGKTFPEAKGEVRRAINILRYFAGEGSRMPGCSCPRSAIAYTCSRCASRSEWWDSSRRGISPAPFRHGSWRRR